MDKQSTNHLGTVEQSLKTKLTVDEQKEKSVFKEPTSLCKITR